ncbi:MFS transporter [Roseospira marina]|uniref:MFS transporter n=1 Tax=Roseospira marina TaxID=140057 RepID=A0A5M6I7P0_9PROT|nr:MFS transporter [Roseospira marina]KAA5604240.1 MFS transporter [Roseospira marina]MBB4315614.1 DHA2 family multidrug resistance protein-like MFS transporter [Roseospira marina]MBB5088610.1 DHA2 family multidrug resistance protein-like MFS transporter [Roseospira marina]
MASSNRWLILAIVSSALLLIVIDMTVLYTALPRLTHDLGATAAEKLWIVNAYPLVVAGLLPGFGTLGDRVGHKRLFLGGLAVFGVASLMAAYAGTPAVLIAARVVLAVGAAMMMPATLSIIRLTFIDEREQALAFGIWSSVASGGAAFGPIVGGLMLESFWWGSVFLINAPIVLVAGVLAIIVIPEADTRRDRPWDLIASIQILSALVGIIYAIKEIAKPSPSYGSFVLAGVVGIAALALFIRRQKYAADPLVDFALFRDARFASGVAAALIASLALVGVELAISQRLQLVLGLSPFEAGLFILPIPLAAFVGSPLAGLGLPRWGGTPILWSALLLAAAGLSGYLLQLDTAGPLQIASMAALGLGLGAAMTAASSMIMLSAPSDRAGMAASIEEVSYELGGAVGIAILGSLLSAVYATSLVLPDSLGASAMAYDGLDQALLVAEGMHGPMADDLRALARAAFDRAFVTVIVAATVILVVTGCAVGLWPRRGRAAIGACR